MTDASGEDLRWPSRFTPTRADRDAVAILLALSPTARQLLRLAQTHRTARRCLEAIRCGEGGSDRDRRRLRSGDLDDLPRSLASAGARLVAVGTPEYPPSLLHLPDPPAGLFVRGDLGGLDQLRAVAVVGARNCSAGGREMARAIGRGLAAAGVWVISGAARGIDSSGHHGALDARGSTVAVLGCGIDVAYPPQNRELLSLIEASGAVVSEYAPGTPADAFRFPGRNRIVAGLARAVVVVEGAPGSGSQITARHALDIGREVFAVPGSPTSPLSAVPLALIHDGATMIRGPTDLLEALRIDAPRPVEAPLADQHQRVEPGAPVDGAALAALGALATPDEVAAAAGLSLPEAIGALVRLELRGLVRSVGGRFERTSRSLP
jgi:DNA processing protein